MTFKNPFSEGKLTDRIQALSNYTATRAVMMRSTPPQVFRDNAELFREHFINSELMVHTLMENILAEAKELISEEFEEFGGGGSKNGKISSTINWGITFPQHPLLFLCPY